MDTKELLLATRNRNKKREFQEMFQDFGIKVINLDDIKGIPAIEEDGQSFAENAIKKALTTAKLSGFTCLADDSGLEVDILEGQPGIYSARFAGEDADDKKNNEKLLQMMEGIKQEHRTARFVCVIAVSDPDGNVETVAGTCEGSIAFSPVGQGGFGYDPLFIPTGYKQSFAELSAEEKNSISHRGKALSKIKPIIKKVLAL
ncbi:MAG: XTP/dITP diphosphatase [Syntrophomonadaceae bacterium]|nr:XTP/dITP diphosphatase [Syntrophomonadaceae bacterium]MDD3889826.1 XTP/dITP diphosphatase [Syntrophomonadaceae bacterium]MDD4549792.1 XTP/dITP diphosphatase [Syntrophomonadaceae bacterium]